MSKKNDWKKREGIVYSTEPSFEYQQQQKDEQPTLPPPQQNLRVFLDKSGRAGKQVTIVTGFTGTTADLEALGKFLKSRCGTGGSVKDGEILIQGDVRKKLADILGAQRYRVKISGG